MARSKKHGSSSKKVAGKTPRMRNSLKTTGFSGCSYRLAKSVLGSKVHVSLRARNVLSSFADDVISKIVDQSVSLNAISGTKTITPSTVLSAVKMLFHNQELVGVTSRAIAAAQK